jgi:hypothetical protein
MKCKGEAFPEAPGEEIVTDAAAAGTPATTLMASDWVKDAPFVFQATITTLCDPGARVA